MIHRRPAQLIALLVAFTGILACGPRETPEQQLQRIRLRHELRPLSYATVNSPEGEPITLVDIDLTNQCNEPLSKLTILVRILDAEGNERHSERVTLDLEGVYPGTGFQTAASLIGVEVDVDGGESLEVLLETNLSDEELRALPEYQDVAPEA